MTLEEIYLRTEEVLTSIYRKIDARNDINPEELELASLENWRESIEEGL